MRTPNKIDNAEKKWEGYFDNKKYPLKPCNDGSGHFWTLSNGKRAISDISEYKQALREAIEKRIKELYDYIRIANLDSPSTITLNRIDTLEQVLEMLDTVTPK